MRAFFSPVPPPSQTLSGTRAERAISTSTLRSQHKQHASHGSDTPSVASMASSTHSGEQSQVLNQAFIFYKLVM